MIFERRESIYQHPFSDDILGVNEGGHPPSLIVHLPAKEARREGPHAPLPLRFSLTRRQFTVSRPEFNLHDCQSDLAIRFDADNRVSVERTWLPTTRRGVVRRFVHLSTLLPVENASKHNLGRASLPLTSVTRHGDNNESVLIGSRERLRGKRM